MSLPDFVDEQFNDTGYLRHMDIRMIGITVPEYTTKMGLSMNEPQMVLVRATVYTYGNGTEVTEAGSSDIASVGQCFETLPTL